MQRNRGGGGGGQGLLGNAPVGFGNQSSAFSNNQSSAFSNGGFGNNLPGFGNNNTNGGSGGGSQNRFADHRNENNAHHSDFSSNVKNPRSDFFASGNHMGSSGKFNNSSSSNSFNASYSSNNFNSSNSSSGGGYSNSSSNHNQPLQQQRNNMQGVGGMSPLHQLQQRQQQQQQQQPNRAPIGFGAGNNGQTLNSPQQQMNQLFNTDRDSQLALVNSLLKGSLIPNNTNAMNLQQQQNQKMQPPHSPIDNMQGMGGMNSMGMNQHGMNQQRMNGNGMNGNGMNMGMNSIQGGGNHGNGGNGVTMGNHLGQGQFGAMGTGLNSGGTGNMGMTSPGGGHSILGMPKGHQGLIGNSQGGLLANSQGLLGNQNSLLGNPSLPRNPDFMHRNSGGLLGRSNSNNRVNNGPRGGNHGYNPNNRPNNRSIQQHNRGRPERRGNSNNTDQHRRHDSRDSRDSHDSRDVRSRHSHDRRDNSIKRDESRNEYSEKRQVALPPSGGCESLRVSVGDGQEEYDPAEPTEDKSESNATSESILLIEADRDRDLGSPEVIYHGGQKRPRSHSPVSRPHTTSGDLKVTVDAQGRSVQDGPPQPKTRRESSGSDVKDGDDQKFTCYACSVDCKDIQHFESHMRSARHRTRMESICNLHVQKTDQQLARMRAEEHLRRIEGREKEDYCRICDKRFVGSFITHRRGQEHRRKERLTKRGCKLCRTGSFVQYCEYVKHIDSEPHKKNKEVLRKQEQTSSHGRDDDDDDIESFPDSFEELVTLDATGIYKNDENDEVISDNDNDDNDSITEEGFSTSTTNNKDQERIKSDSTDNNPSVQTLLQSEQSEAEDDEENTKPVVVKVEKDECPAAEKVSPAARLHTQDQEVNQQTVLSLPEFDSEMPVGQDHVVPMEGFFCKLCKKFYMSEKAARFQHCRTRTHFDMYIAYQKALHSKKAGWENSVDEQQTKPCQNSNIEDDTPMPEEDDAPMPEAAVEASASLILNNGNDMGVDDEDDANDFQDLSEQNENGDEDDTQEDHEIDEQEEVTENSVEPLSPTNVTVINGDIFTIQPVVNGNEKAILENGSQEEQENGIDEEEEMEPSPTAAKKSLRVRRGRSRRGRAK